MIKAMFGAGTTGGGVVSPPDGGAVSSGKGGGVPAVTTTKGAKINSAINPEQKIPLKKLDQIMVSFRVR